MEINVLELFAGSRSIGKAAEKFGMNVFSSDLNNFENIDYAIDILDFDIKKIPFKPDIIWASPPCSSRLQSTIFKSRLSGSTRGKVP